LKQLVFKLKKVDHDYREACLIHMTKEIYTEKVIIFFKTKKTCHRLAILFGLFGLRACELHGNLSQSQRVTAFQDFKAGKYQYLLATDLASRGLDIKDIKTVINFELPIGKFFFSKFL
jgi:ATP-dependent RNA helicase DDX27